MANNSPDKEPHALLTHYVSLFKSKYGTDPKINRYREKWAMQDVVDSVGYVHAKDLLEYYFTLNKAGHPLNFFFYNFDKIDRLRKEVEDDKVKRDMLRYETKTMVEEGRNDEHRGNSDIGGM